MKRSHLALLVIAVLVGGWWSWRRAVAPLPAVAAARATTPADALNGPEPVATDVADVASAPSAALPPLTTPLTSATLVDRRLRAEAERRLRALAPTPAAPDERLAPDGEPIRPLALDPEYLRRRVHDDFFPLARQCYDNALSGNPTLAGTLVLAFTIVGDERVGGIVEDAALDPSGTLQDEELRRCMRESMMTMTFPAPAHGGRVTVTYPFEFSPDPSPATSPSAR